MKKIKIIFILLLFLIVFLTKTQENVPTLGTTVSKELKGTKGSYGLYIKNLKTQEKYILNGDRVFDSGSLYKLWLMEAVFEKIERQELKEDQVLTSDINDLNQKFEIAKVDAELAEGTISLSVKSALEQMITISHNYAALLLTDSVGKTGIPIRTTASDVGLFYEKLYKGEIVNEENSLKMIEILKRQKLNDGLPKNLPKEIKIAHKTGDIGWFKHDGGIIFAEFGDYIIVVLSESKSPKGAQERIANVSKSVYDYFGKKEK